jgi:hypothetical protein
MEAHIAAFVESEHGEGDCDENHDGDDADGILRVFTVPGNERTAGISPRAVDPSLKINGRSLAVSNGRVFFRTLAAGRQVSPRCSGSSMPERSVTTLCKPRAAAVQGGQWHFLRPNALSTGCRRLVERTGRHGPRRRRRSAGRDPGAQNLGRAALRVASPRGRSSSRRPKPTTASRAAPI